MPFFFRDSMVGGAVAVDWPMIFVGWRGFARRKLSAEQVIAHALEQIGKGTPEQDGVAALLANADTSDWQTIDRYVGQLAGTERSDKELALRKWRLAELGFLLNDLHPLDDSSDEDEDEWYSVEVALTDFWLAYNEELSDSANRIPQFSGSVQEMLAEQRAWAEQEEAVLRSSVEAGK